MSWLSDWDEAAKKPRLTIATMCLAGAAGGVLAGYVVNDNLEDGLALGVCFGAVLGFMGWRTVRSPARLAELRARKQEPTRILRLLVSLVVVFAPLAVATAAGLLARSSGVFILVLAVGMAVAITVGRRLGR